MILHSTAAAGTSTPHRGVALHAGRNFNGGDTCVNARFGFWRALVLVASLVIGPGATASPQKATAGTVVFIHDQEPPNLQGPWVGNNLYATSLVLNNIWYGCQIRDSTGGLVPRLCVAKPKLIKANPLTVRFEYKKAAMWSDGKPVVAKDFRATWQVFMNPKNNDISRTGWEDIESVTVERQERHGRLQEAVRRLGGRCLERPVPGARHRGQEHEPDVPDLGAGLERPVDFGSWQKGVQIAVRKNPRFKAGTADEARPPRLPLHPGHELPLPGAEGRRGSGDGAAAAAPDRRVPEGQHVQGRHARSATPSSTSTSSSARRAIRR